MDKLAIGLAKTSFRVMWEVIKLFSKILIWTGRIIKNKNEEYQQKKILAAQTIANRAATLQKMEEDGFEPFSPDDNSLPARAYRVKKQVREQVKADNEYYRNQMQKQREKEAEEQRKAG